jgi:hypothetical protein
MGLAFQLIQIGYSCQVPSLVQNAEDYGLPTETRDRGEKDQVLFEDQ